MNRERAHEILSDTVKHDGSLSKSSDLYLDYMPGRDVAILDGEFTADELEAIAWWMRAHNKPEGGMK